MTDKRKVFFTALLTTLLIISNIILPKMTVIANLPLSCSIFTYPFTFLCVLIIAHLYGAMEAIKSVGYALFCQILVFIVCIIITNVPNQVDTLMEANALQQILTPQLTNGIYIPNIFVMVGIIVSFAVSQLVNIGLYTASRKHTFKAVSSSLSILFAYIIDTVLFSVIVYVGISTNNLALTIVNKFIVGVITTIISVILFCIFTIGDKKKENVKKKKSID